MYGVPCSEAAWNCYFKKTKFYFKRQIQRKGELWKKAMNN